MFAFQALKGILIFTNWGTVPIFFMDFGLSTEVVSRMDTAIVVLED